MEKQELPATDESIRMLKLGKDSDFCRWLFKIVQSKIDWAKHQLAHGNYDPQNPVSFGELRGAVRVLEAMLKAPDREIGRIQGALNGRAMRNDLRRAFTNVPIDT